jgi:ABC-2 type transport system permease protein
VIAADLRVNLLRLVRDPASLVLTFLLPPVFFSVFAVVFARLDGGAPTARTVQFECVVDEAWCARLSALLTEQAALQLVVPDGATSPSAAVQSGRVAAALRVESVSRIRMWTDPGDPIAARALPAQVRAAVVALALMLPPGAVVGFAESSAGVSGAVPAAAPAPPVVTVEADSGAQPSVAFFAAGIGVMFALLSASGRAALVIADRESGVGERLRSSGVGRGPLLLSRWLFLSGVCTAQLAVMLAWARLAFALDVFAPGAPTALAALVPATAMTAAAFGLLLAYWSTTRAQLTALATALVLPMSAVAGSLLPRSLLPEAVNAVGGWLFNAWALDGFRKVFWRGQGLVDLDTELLVLALNTAAGLALCLLRRYD